MLKAKDKIYENEEIEDLPIIPAGLIEGIVPAHSHDGFGSEDVLEGTTIVGGTIKSSYSGARALFFPDANTGFQVIDDDGADVFKAIVGGTDVGDVIIGDYASNQGAKYDKSAGTFDFKGVLTAEAGHIGGWNIDATRIYSDSDEIVLDSANKRIEVGADDAIVLDGVNKKITIGASTPITIDGVNKKIESDNYVSGYAGAGFHLDEDLLEVGNIAARGLIRTAVFQKDVISSIGGNFMVIDSDVLDADMTAADASTLTTKATTTFSVGDILRIKDRTDDEWLEVTAVNGAVYTCNRDKAAAYGAGANPAWKKGATVVNYGQTGDGGIFMTASESNAPYLSVFTHAGSPWSALTTRLRIGNLNGYLGYSSDLYGIGIGDVTHYLKYDPTNHLQISGTITGGTIQTAASGQRITINGADNYLRIYDASAQIGALGGSTDGASRLLDLTPKADIQMTRFLARDTTGTGSILYSVSKGYQSNRFVNENTNVYRTTNSVPMLSFFQIGTGSAIQFMNSNPNSDGKVFDIQQHKVATAEPIFKIKQGGITSTNFRKLLTETDTSCTIWISDGTTPNGNLSGQAGDICLNGDAGNIYRCTGTTNWTAM